MLDEADRRLVRLLYNRCLTRDQTHGRTPHILATAVTCVATFGDAVVQHIGYAILTIAAGETYDGSPVGSTVRTHVRKGAMLGALAIGAAAAILLLGPVWLSRCAWLRIIAPCLASLGVKQTPDRVQPAADHPETSKPPCRSTRSSKRSRDASRRSQSSR